MRKLMFIIVAVAAMASCKKSSSNTYTCTCTYQANGSPTSSVVTHHYASGTTQTEATDSCNFSESILLLSDSTARCSL